MAETVEKKPGRTGLKILAVAFGLIFTAVLGSTAFFEWNLKGDGPLLTGRFPAAVFVDALWKNLPWLVLFTLLSSAMLPLRAIQWQRTLETKVPLRERWHFVNIGALVQNLLPGNLGDVTRSFLLARTQRLPVVVGLGSVAVCKLLELATLVILAAIALSLPYWSHMPALSNALGTAAWVFVALITLVVLLARYATPLAAKLERKKRLPKLQVLLGHVDAGLGTARSLKGMLIALIFSFPPNLAAALAYGIGLRMMGVEHGLAAGALVLALIALGKGAPGIAPGPGMYFLVVSWAAREFGASPEDAAAYALLTNIATGVSHWIPGLVSVVVRRIKWSELRAQTSMAREAAHGVKPGRAPVPAEA